MTAKIAASTEIAYTAQENEHARLSKLYNLYFEYSFLKTVPQNLQDVVPTALSVNVSVPFPHTEYCSSQAETLHLHSFFPEGQQQPGTFTSQDRPCMKTGRSDTELFFTFCHSLSSLCLFFPSVQNTTGALSWPIMGNCIFPKSPPDLPSQASPYQGPSLSPRLLYSPVNLPFLGCTQKL